MLIFLHTILYQIIKTAQINYHKLRNMQAGSMVEIANNQPIRIISIFVFFFAFFCGISCGMREWRHLEVFHVVLVPAVLLFGVPLLELGTVELGVLHGALPAVALRVRVLRPLARVVDLRTR